VMIAMAVWHASAWTLQAVNRVRRQATVYVTVNLVAVGIMLALTEKIGIVLPAAALLAADTVMAIFVVTQTLAYLDERPGAFALSLLVPPFDQLRRLRGR
jgi:GT2 family glycosyltransferase